MLALKNKTFLLLGLFAGIAGVNAQTLSIDESTGNINSVAPHEFVSVTLTPQAADVAGIDFDMSYSPTTIGTPFDGADANTFMDIVVTAPAGDVVSISCSNPAAGSVVCTGTDTQDSLAGPITIAIPFAIGATPGLITLGFTSTSYSDGLGATQQFPVGSTDGGTLNISAGPQPALGSVPTPASTITINDIIGGGATTGTLTITNSGQVGSTLNIGAPTGLSGVLSITPNTAQATAQGSTGVAYTISCAAVAAGATSQVLSFTHNGTSPGSPVTYNVDCVGAVGPTAPTASLGAATQPAAGVINQVATGSVPVNVDSAGIAAASLALNCTIPATGASNFLVTAGGTRTITAPAALGANAPAIGVSCVRQAAAVSATLTCAQNATPDPDPAALTVQIDCPAGTTAPNFVSSPAPGGTIALAGATGDVVAGSLPISNSVGTAALDISTCTASAGFTLTSTFPLSIAAGASSAVNFTCVAPGAGVSTAGTLTCDHNAPNVASPVSYVLSCTGVSGVVPAMDNLGKILLVSLMIGLGMLGMGLRRQA